MAERYRTIVADPPWPMPSGGGYTNSSGHERWRKNMGARKVGSLPYVPMSLEDISRFPVDRLAAPGAHLYLWTTNAFLEQSYDVARAWDFEPSTVLVWAKTPRGLGLGGAYTCTTEFVLFCRLGTLKAKTRVDSTWWNWKRPHNAHSAKPEAFLDLVEQVSPGPYLELFARRDRLGWDTYGNECLSPVEVAT